MEKILTLFLIFIVFSCMEPNSLFRPIVWDGNKHIVDTTIQNSEFYENFKQVLDYYGYKYEEKNDSTFYISKRLTDDYDMLMNLTNKAKDSDWLKSHIRK